MLLLELIAPTQTAPARPLGFPATGWAATSSSVHGAGGYGRRKVRPNLAADPEGTQQLNLTVLCHLDPAVADILITVVHVTTYNFDPSTVQWTRKGVEGSFFVVKRFVL